MDTPSTENKAFDMEWATASSGINMCVTKNPEICKKNLPFVKVAQYCLHVGFRFQKSSYTLWLGIYFHFHNEGNLCTSYLIIRLAKARQLQQIFTMSNPCCRLYIPCHYWLLSYNPSTNLSITNDSRTNLRITNLRPSVLTFEAKQINRT